MSSSFVNTQTPYSCLLWFLPSFFATFVFFVVAFSSSHLVAVSASLAAVITARGFFRRRVGDSALMLAGDPSHTQCRSGLRLAA
eukprot:6464437-Prymnesium_polylepis.1